MSRSSDHLRRRLRGARERLIATNIDDPALSVCISGIARMENALRRPLRVVILGESNSGKTSVAGLLIGDGLLPTSVVSNTHIPVLITYAETPALYGVDANATRIRIDSDDGPPTGLPYRAIQIALPIERLRDYQILDTPSLPSPATFVGDADIVIWCTVATRAWTESERATWSGLPQRCSRNALLVATHKDGLQTDEEIAAVTERLRSLTSGLFQDIVLVAAENVSDGSANGSDAVSNGSDSTPGDGTSEDAASNDAKALRDRLSRLASNIVQRRTRKAESIVRRLARVTFHRFARDDIGPAQAALLSSWEMGANHLLDLLAEGRRTTPVAIEELLTAYAFFAEKLRPGVVTGDSRSASQSRAVTAPIRWPKQNAAAVRLVRMLVSDLTGLLRMLAGGLSFTDPAAHAERQTARAIVLELADLDGAFEALGRMVGSPASSERPTSNPT